MRLNIVHQSDDLNGLFMFLFTQHTEKYVRSIVNVSASGTAEDRPEPFVSINPKLPKEEYTSTWMSDKEENSNFTITFISMEFAIDAYTIQSRKGIDHNNPLAWILEGSKDMIHWETIHRKPKGNELSGDGLIYYHQCPHSGFFKILRITMIGENNHYQDKDKYFFAFRQIELFGTLIETHCQVRESFVIPNVLSFIYLLIVL